jgi:formate dehydrogenase major subunit
MNAMGYNEPYLTPAQIMDEIASLTPSYHGISFERLDCGESLQWPCPEKDHPGTPIMHVGKPVRGKVLLYPAKFKEAQELPDEEYPYILMTGRILYHYNAFSMTSRSPGLMDISGEGFIEINTLDAKELEIKNGDMVRVSSRRGSIQVKARIGRKVSRGETWMPFHFPDSPVNMITNAALDEFAKIPEYKVCAVKLEKS